MKQTIYIFLIAALLPVCISAQPTDKKYQVGIRSTLILGEMELSTLDPSFDNLSAAGGLGQGAHHSSVFFLYAARPHMRVGFETLVGNSTEDEATTMDFQAAGLVVDFLTRGRLFAAGGLHTGPIIANAMHRTDMTSDTKVQTGRHFKSGGLFFAPYAALGLHIRHYEVRLFVKRVNVFTPEENIALDAFSASYAGLSVGYAF